MPQFYNYDPSLVTVSFFGIQLTGYMDGTFISAEREVDAFEKSSGAAGDVVRVRSRNRTGAVTVTLQSSSQTNDLLSSIALADEIDGSGVGSLMVKNINGTTIVEAASAWIQKMPVVEFADTAGGREWVFACSELVMNVGGALA